MMTADRNDSFERQGYVMQDMVSNQAVSRVIQYLWHTSLLTALISIMICPTRPMLTNVS